MVPFNVFDAESHEVIFPVVREVERGRKKRKRGGRTLCVSMNGMGG